MRAEMQALMGVLEVVSFPVVEGDSRDDLPLPYAVVIPGRNADEQTRFTGADVAEVIQFSIRCVGADVNQASWADEQVDRALRPNRKGIRLTGEGWECSRLQRRASDLYPDDSASRVWEAISTYRCTSTPI